jgi:hypothetical protein
MAQHGIPMYLDNRPAGNVLMPVARLHVYGTGGWVAADTAAYADLHVGNANNVNAAGQHAEGRIYLYSAATKAHILRATSTTTEYSHYLPNATGWIATGGNGGTTGVGSST